MNALFNPVAGDQAYEVPPEAFNEAKVPGQIAVSLLTTG
jgi:hypothetical protein